MLIINLEKLETFECDVERIEGKDLCLFHDETYLKDSNHPENKKMVIEKLQEKIENSKKTTPLKCFGYYLPDIELNKEEFTQQIYFNYCKCQKAYFSGAKLKEAVNFSGTTFKEAASFSEATFSSSTSFSEATFKEAAYFFKATFSSEADFSKTDFNDAVDFNR